MSSAPAYEFHPVNTTSPYEDNACTATRQIAAVPAGAGGGPAPRAGGTPTGTALALAGLAVLAFATVGLIRMARRPWAAGRPAPR